MHAIIRKALTGLILLISYFSTVSGQTTVYYNYDAAGNRVLRTITLTKADKLENDTSQVISKNSEVLTDSIGDKKILLYPNPTKGNIKIEIIGYQPTSNSGLYLYNLSGSLVKYEAVTSTSLDEDLSGYPGGIYILKIVLGDKMTEWKIVKE